MLRTNLAPIELYLADALTLGDDGFLARHPWPVWIVSDPGPDVLPGVRRSKTIVEAIEDPRETLLRCGLAGASLDALCLEARPKLGDASNRVSIGRAPEADVVLLHESVSRFHAELTWGEDRERCVLADLGSRNGTWADYLRVPKNGRAELFSGEVVCFGTLSTRFYTPRAFIGWLQNGAPRAGAPRGARPRVKGQSASSRS